MIAAATRTRVPLAALCVAVALGAWLRCAALDAGGFSEDEIDIVRATARYEQLDFSANAEHPMLAKLAAFGSMRAAARWNASPHPVDPPNQGQFAYAFDRPVASTSRR